MTNPKLARIAVRIVVGLSLALSLPGDSVLTRRPLAASGTGTVLILKSVPEGSNWVAAIEATSSKQPAAYLASAVLNALPSNVQMRKLDALADLPSGSYSAENGMITVDLTGITATGFLVYLVLPPGPVTCMVNGKTVVDRVQVKNSLMLRSGLLYDEPVTMLAALMRLSSQELPGPKPPEPDYTVLRDGTIVAGKENLKKHLLIHSYPPGGSFLPACKDCHRVAGAIIDIDEAGRVAKVVRTDGEESLRSVVSAAVKDWVFTPFLRDNVPVRVQAALFFNTSSDGKVRSSID